MNMHVHKVLIWGFFSVIEHLCILIDSHELCLIAFCRPESRKSIPGTYLLREMVWRSSGMLPIHQGNRWQTTLSCHVGTNWLNSLHLFSALSDAQTNWLKRLHCFSRLFFFPLYLVVHTLYPDYGFSALHPCHSHHTPPLSPRPTACPCPLTSSRPPREECFITHKVCWNSQWGGTRKNLSLLLLSFP